MLLEPFQVLLDQNDYMTRCESFIGTIRKVAEVENLQSFKNPQEQTFGTPGTLKKNEMSATNPTDQQLFLFVEKPQDPV